MLSQLIFIFNVIFNDCEHISTSQAAVFKTGGEDFKYTPKL